MKRPWRRLPSTEERFSDGNRLTLLRDGPATFRAMLEAIDGARDRVLFEMYWFENDSIGRRFRDALVAARKRGVQIAVLFDAVGSIGLSTAFFSPLVEGSEVRVYNPLTPFRSKLSRLSRRDHRKLLVADDIAFTGGVNIAEPWAPTDGVTLPWRDDCVEVRGPAVAELAACFGNVWRSLDGSPLEAVLPPKGSNSATDSEGARVAVVAQALPSPKKALFNAYFVRLMLAQRRIWIANAYFLPNGKISRALRYAALRGVDVRILVPGKSDVEIVRHASRAVWGRLLKAGARIFEYQPSILHSKTAVIDSEWSTIGSFNLDYRSYSGNLELNVSVLDRAFAETVEASFEQDWEQAVEVLRHQFQHRSLSDRVFETTAYWFRSWL